MFARAQNTQGLGAHEHTMQDEAVPRRSRSRRPYACRCLVAVAAALLVALTGPLAPRPAWADEEPLEVVEDQEIEEEVPPAVEEQDTDKLYLVEGNAIFSDATELTDGAVLQVSKGSTATYAERITVTGSVTIRLEAGSKLKAKKGVTVAEGATLTITGAGTLEAKGDATVQKTDGDETKLTRYEAVCSAGIGAAGPSDTCGTVVIDMDKDGTVKAWGAGVKVAEGTLRIGGVEICDTDAPDTLVTVAGAPGIGGKNGTVTVRGGMVASVGGNGYRLDPEDDEPGRMAQGAAGIGGFSGTNGGTVTIAGGKVTATAGYRAAAIGAGNDAGEGRTDVIVSGGTVDARYDDGTPDATSVAGTIGAGYKPRGEVHVSVEGAAVTGDLGASYGPESDVEVAVRGGTVAGRIGIGEAGPEDAVLRVRLGWTEPSDAIDAVYPNVRADQIELEGYFYKDGDPVRAAVTPEELATLPDQTKIVPLTSGYTVAFDTGEGSPVGSQTVDPHGYAAEPAAPVREGYDFAGWYVDAGLSAAYDFLAPVTCDITLYAKWAKKADPTPVPDPTPTPDPDPEPAPAPTPDPAPQPDPDPAPVPAPAVKKYKVRFDACGGSEVSSQKVAKGKKVKRPGDPTRKGYVFKGWYTSTKLAKKYDFSAPVTASFTLYARWVPELDVSIVVGEGSPALTSSNFTEVAQGLVSDADRAAGTVVGLESAPLAKDEVDDDTAAVASAELKKQGLTAGLWFDLSLYKQVGDADAIEVEQTTAPVKFGLTIPKGLLSTAEGIKRSFSLLRIHDGKVSVLAATTKEQMAFETDCFSTYLLAYKDVQATGRTKVPYLTRTTRSGVPTPGTGDVGNRMWAVLVCLGIAAMAAGAARRRVRSW